MWLTRKGHGNRVIVHLSRSRKLPGRYPHGFFLPLSFGRSLLAGCTNQSSRSKVSYNRKNHRKNPVTSRLSFYRTKHHNIAVGDNGDARFWFLSKPNQILPNLFKFIQTCPNFTQIYLKKFARATSPASMPPAS